MEPGATGPATKVAAFCIWDISGAVEEIVNESPPVIPPPGAGVETVTRATPAVAISAAAIDAVNWLGPRKIVGRNELFHNTTEELTKFDPLTVRRKSPPPAVVLPGRSDEITGTGLVGPIVTPARWTVAFSTADRVTD